MSDKFQNKYRIQSTRLQNWNYGWNAAYFVTICTQNRACYFGEIAETQNLASPQDKASAFVMQLSEIGVMAEKFWSEIPEHFPFVILDEFVVMPDHVHGIIMINKTVETQNVASLSIENQNKFGPQSKNLASIIRGFKIGVTKYARNNNIDFAWQPRYHDHIIRDERSFKNIRNYIFENPLKWGKDNFL
jgi:REP element-mobilizing transposase RayT